MRQEATRALCAGRNAEIGAANPYRGQLALAKCWMRGYLTNLTARIESGPAMQRYLAARGAAGRSSG